MSNLLKIVVWGIGTNGKNLIDVLGYQNVLAIIETNKIKIESGCYADIPIIDLDTYIEKYNQLYIVVSPMKYQSIEKVLKDKQINRYFILKKSKVSLGVYLAIRDGELIKKYIKDRNRPIYIKGNDFFCIYLYCFLLKKEYQVFLVSDSTVSQLFFKELVENDIIQNYINDFDVPNRGIVFVPELALKDTNSQFYKLVDYNSLNQFVHYRWKQDLQKFKNCRQGGRVFIIATGPSLEIRDLEKLHINREFTISVNRIYHVFDKTQWRPDYYVASDGNMIRDYEKMLEVQEWFRSTEKFFSDNYIKFFYNNLDESYHCFRQIQETEHVEFTSDFSDKVYSGLTVVYACLQLAVYMGFKEIYLMGCDFDFSTNFDSNKDHFYGGNEHVRKGEYNFDYDFVRSAYLVARQYAEQHGIHIFNVTRGGKLEVFRRVDFDKLFEEK